MKSCTASYIAVHTSPIKFEMVFLCTGYVKATVANEYPEATYLKVIYNFILGEIA